MRLIDADGLKRKVQKEATESWKMKIKASVETILNQVIDWIDEAQTVEPAQQWIPVTERLPKKYIGEWLCCDKYGNIFILRYENTTPNGDCVFCYTENDGYSVSVPDVVAWMPLPAPWEGGAEDA